eukprot:CAMPEP_0175087516 /NCGR_PEP_ID=MMETSP0052_2-20121109/29872_1 /TAXON_ID=51329 ORGANISM="Polytomella parva, Strain SAG 63-3" /NCGR_SAMPLE_ID=MMETSP0052_2 /ASSEMBLY_ACC=CAM_ASM_000194 /LENGTH=358 /DNA_ID=CAMNT_0016359867 /DNA_START=1105 /DNA_END=2182 /DNA_ORIENTATION=-
MVFGIKSGVEQLEQADFDPRLVVVSGLVLDDFDGDMGLVHFAPATDDLSEGALPQTLLHNVSVCGVIAVCVTVVRIIAVYVTVVRITAVHITVVRIIAVHITAAHITVTNVIVIITVIHVIARGGVKGGRGSVSKASRGRMRIDQHVVDVQNQIRILVVVPVVLHTLAGLRQHASWVLALRVRIIRVGIVEDIDESHGHSQQEGRGGGVRGSGMGVEGGGGGCGAKTSRWEGIRGMDMAVIAVVVVIVVVVVVIVVSITIIINTILIVILSIHTTDTTTIIIIIPATIGPSHLLESLLPFSIEAPRDAMTQAVDAAKYCALYGRKACPDPDLDPNLDPPGVNGVEVVAISDVVGGPDA